MKTYIIGDIHGEYGKLMKCLKSVDFDYENDKLINLGDVCDRGPDTYRVVEELLKIKNLVSIRGNHDACWLEGLKIGTKSSLWSQGGRETALSYVDAGVSPEIHFNFFNKQLPYYIDEERNLFIHGGFNRHKELDEQPEHVFYWDRDLWLAALSYQGMKNNEYPFKIKGNFKHIYIGHTPTTYFDSTILMTAANITNLDTGSGKGGLLTIMNLETKEYKQF